jgi:hypothetical protein
MLQRLASSLALGARRLQPDRLKVLLQLEAAPQFNGCASGLAQTMVSCYGIRYQLLRAVQKQLQLPLLLLLLRCTA